MPEKEAGCARPTGAKVGEPSVKNKKDEAPEREKEMDTVKVGSKAPDFQAPAYYKGSFTNVKLSDFLGKWILLCFYPGDFTFV